MRVHQQCSRCGHWFDVDREIMDHNTQCPVCLPPVQPETTTDRAVAWLYSIADMLKEKGRKYGNSLDNPVRIFSKADKAEGLAVRIDDKLARIRASQPDDGEDSVADLVGYIALLKGLRDDS